MEFWKCKLEGDGYVYLNPNHIVSAERHCSNKEVVWVRTIDGKLHSLVREDIEYRFRYSEKKE